MKKSKLLPLYKAIEQCYGAYNVYISLTFQPQYSGKNSALFKVHMKLGTTLNSLKSHAEDVQTVMEIPFFIITKQKNGIFLLVSSTNTRFITLNNMLHASSCVCRNHRPLMSLLCIALTE